MSLLRQLPQVERPLAWPLASATGTQQSLTESRGKGKAQRRDKVGALQAKVLLPLPTAKFHPELAHWLVPAAAAVTWRRRRQVPAGRPLARSLSIPVRSRSILRKLEVGRWTCWTDSARRRRRRSCTRPIGSWRRNSTAATQTATGHTDTHTCAINTASNAAATSCRQMASECLIEIEPIWWRRRRRE